MAIELERIEFKDGRENPVKAEQFNTMQDNIENAINDSTEIETIINERGVAIKYPDGRLECRLNDTRTDIAINSPYGSTGLYIGSYYWTFPVPFTNNPIVICGMFRWGTGASWGICTGSTQSTASLAGLDVLSREAGIDVKLQAIAYGYWK